MHDTKPEIFPIYDKVLSRHEKEKQLKQNACVVWLTGLSGSGKSTIALALEKQLHKKGYTTMLLDGDNVRSGINNNLGFSAEDRKENIRRIAEVSKLFLQAGIITINSFVSPTEEIRSLAREIIGPENMVEVFINTPIEECERRDVKGLYKKARAGKIPDFTGISAPFEPPINADLEIKTVGQTVAESTQQLFNNLQSKITYNQT